MDLTQIIPYALAHAQGIGLALLGLGIVVRLLGRAMSRVLLLAGVLATTAFAYQEWQVLHSVVVAGGILVAGLLVFGLLAWTVRGLSFLVAFALLGAAFYLIVYGWMGPTFVATTVGSLTWAGATILTMILTGLGGGLLHRAPQTVVGAGVAP